MKATTKNIIDITPPYINKGLFDKITSLTDIKELAVMFMIANNMDSGDNKLYTFNELSDIFGIETHVLRQWLADYKQEDKTFDIMFRRRIKERQSYLLEKLFAPLESALSELTKRISSAPESFTNAELLRAISVLTTQYTNSTSHYLETSNQTTDNNNLDKLRNIITGAKSRMVIDQQD